MTSQFSYRTASGALPFIAQELLEKGKEVGSRNGRVKELLNVQIKLERPYFRETLTEGRGANIFAQIAETMWVLAGRNDIEWLSHYLPRAKDYSDDGLTWRGGYGPRLRGFGTGLDQLNHVVELLREDPLSRRAVISLYDPEIDMAPGKDIPCNDFLQFQSRLGELHMTVTVRSNDLFWGWSGINAFEWSVLQEIVASMLGIQPGPLVFNIGSLHLYEHHWERASRMKVYNGVTSSRIWFDPHRKVKNVQDLDEALDRWFTWEHGVRTGQVKNTPIPEGLPKLFQQWAYVIAYYWTQKEEWLAPLKGTRLATAITLTPQSLQKPSERSQAGPGHPGQPPALSDRSAAFYAFVSDLHETKHAAYGDSWKKRGEQMSILANIARKVDRLGADDKFETLADTVIDLWVYLAKYLDWINEGESGPAEVNEMLLAGLQKFDAEAPSEASHDLKTLAIRADDYLSLSDAYSQLGKTFAVQGLMDYTLPLALRLWEAEQGERYRGADVD